MIPDEDEGTQSDQTSEPQVEVPVGKNYDEAVAAKQEAEGDVGEPSDEDDLDDSDEDEDEDDDDE